MSETSKAKNRPTLLDGSRTDLEAGVLPRVPVFPASNYTYAKRAERMRAAATEGYKSGVLTEILLICGSNTYARVARAYGQILIEYLTRQAELAEAVNTVEKQVAEVVEAKPKKVLAKKAAAKEVA